MAAFDSEWLIALIVFAIVAYPIVGGLAFVVSSFYYRIFLEKKDRPRDLQHGEPFVTILIPAHNEEASIESTVRYLESMINYPQDKFEIIVADDASTDATPQILARLREEFPHLRVVTILENRGKAHAFNVARVREGRLHPLE